MATEVSEEVLRRSATFIASRMPVDENEAQVMVLKAFAGGEFPSPDFESVEHWITHRLLPNTVLINLQGYTEMCVDALKIASGIAATDYGGSRQRDLGQLWADMTRGYLGEYGIKLFLRQNWGIDIRLGHEVGTLEEYLPTDISEILDHSGTWRKPRIRVGVKTTKFNGIWLDIPGNQFDHSDIHVQVKVATGRDHLFSFFKHISVFRDKVLKSGISVGSLTEVQADDLFSKLPTFREIPAYVTGFAERSAVYSALPFAGKKGRKNYTVTSWNGPIKPGDLDLIKSQTEVTGKVQFQGIGDFAHDTGYLFNTGNLLWQRVEWDRVVALL